MASNSDSNAIKQFAKQKKASEDNRKNLGAGLEKASQMAQKDIATMYPSGYIWDDIGESAESYSEFERVFLEVLAEKGVNKKYPKAIWQKAGKQRAKQVWTKWGLPEPAPKATSRYKRT